MGDVPEVDAGVVAGRRRRPAPDRGRGRRPRTPCCPRAPPRRRHRPWSSPSDHGSAQLGGGRRHRVTRWRGRRGCRRGAARHSAGPGRLRDRWDRWRRRRRRRRVLLMVGAAGGGGGGAGPPWGRGRWRRRRLFLLGAELAVLGLVGGQLAEAGVRCSRRPRRSRPCAWRRSTRRAHAAGHRPCAWPAGRRCPPAPPR